MSTKVAVTNRPFQRSDTKEYVKAGVKIEGAAEYIGELMAIGLAREVKVQRGMETKAPEPKAKTAAKPASKKAD